LIFFNVNPLFEKNTLDISDHSDGYNDKKGIKKKIRIPIIPNSNS